MTESEEGREGPFCYGTSENSSVLVSAPKLCCAGGPATECQCTKLTRQARGCFHLWYRLMVTVSYFVESHVATWMPGKLASAGFTSIIGTLLLLFRIVPALTNTTTPCVIFTIIHSHYNSSICTSCWQQLVQGTTRDTSS